MTEEDVRYYARNSMREEEYWNKHKICPDCGGTMIRITAIGQRWHYECKECGTVSAYD